MDAGERTDLSPFGDLLRRHRLAAGLTQEELAERAGLSRRGISDLERTARSHPYRETAKVLADALSLTGGERSTFFLAAKRPVRRGAARRGSFTRLPVLLTPLIGRQEERTAVRHLLHDDTVRLVTLTGPGGVGKTRLALGAAEETDEAFPDGVVFVDLAPLRDPSLVLAHVASTLGLQESGQRTLLDVVSEHLRPREVLLLLDNFEHLLAAAPVVLELLTAGPRVKTLVTSRAPLRVRGEREYPVAPLRLPTPADSCNLTALATSDAIAFFVDRVTAVRPDFTLTPENAPAITEICTRLDGLPLALELAAARAKILPPATMLGRLQTRLPLLSGGPRDAPQRQKTLRDAITWSYDLLEPGEQVLFRRLAVFVGGWTLEAAEAVANARAGLDFEVLTGLASLADHSLIRLGADDPAPRFGMLETIREYAAERLAASSDAEWVRAAHARYFHGLAEQAKPELYGAGQRAWLQRLEAEHPNFRAALVSLAAGDNREAHIRLVANLGLFWFLRAHLSEGRGHLELTLARAPAPTPVLAEALTGLGRLAVAQGDLSAAESWLEQGEALARALDAPDVLWQALFTRGIVAEYEGDDDRERAFYEAALAIARQQHDAQATSVVLYALSEASYRHGDLQAAGRLAEEAVRLVRSVGDEFVLSLSLANIGQAALARGDANTAADAYHEALDLAVGIGADWAIANALNGFAAIAAARGQHVAAARLLGATEAVRQSSYQERIPSYTLQAQTTEAVRGTLGEDAFAAARESGRAVSRDDVATLPHTLGLIG